MLEQLKIEENSTKNKLEEMEGMLKKPAWTASGRKRTP